MNNKTIIEFGFRIIWRIMAISEGVIRRGRDNLTPSSITIILHKVLSLTNDMLYLNWLYFIRRITQPGYAGSTTNLQIILNTPRKSLIRSSHPKTHLPNFPTQKNPGIKNFQPPKNPSLIFVTWNLKYPQAPPPRTKGSNFKALTGKIWVF